MSNSKKPPGKNITEELRNSKIKKHTNKEKLILQLQPKSNNVTLITRDLADKVFGNVPASSVQNVALHEADFPELGAHSNLGITRNVSTQLSTENVTVQTKTRGIIKIELAPLLKNQTNKSTKQIRKQKVRKIEENYSGNPLDSDLPVRKRGKCKQTPKVKSLTKLKQEILQEKNEISEKNQISNICDNVITEELNNLVRCFISLTVERQEKLYRRDTIKAVAKRKYVVGLHEAKKYLNLNKVKILIFASDLQVAKEDGALHNVIKQLIISANTNGIQYLFALKRRLLGELTLKYRPISCMAVLNCEGLEQDLKDVVELLMQLKEEHKKIHELNTIESGKNEDVNIYLLNNLKEALISAT